MNQPLTVQRRRELGELLTDPFKFIFRNLREITVFLLPYIMLPFIIAFIFLTQLQMNILSMENSDFSPEAIIKMVIMLIGIIIATLHAPLASVCIIKAAREDGGDDIQYSSLTRHFKELYARNAIWIVSAVVIFSIPFIIFIFLSTATPVIGVIILVFFSLFSLLYLFPLFLYSYFSYLMNLELSLAEAFAKGKQIVDSYWGISIGLIFLSGIVSNMLQYMIMIPYLILIMVLSTALDFNTESNMYISMMTIQNVIYGFALCYLLLYSTLVFLLKYFDIEEQEHGTSMLEEISNIGKKESAYFDNEGSY